MSIHRDKTRGQFIFEFDRTIEGQRIRARSRLPKAWTRTEADAYDRKESARLYAVATGIARDRPTVERAIELYLQDKTHLKTHKEAARVLASLYGYYHGRYLDELPEIAAEISKQEKAPASIKYEISLVRAAGRWAWKKHGLGEHDPGERVQVPVVRNERHVYPKVHQMLRMMRHCRNPGARATQVAAFYTGMRLGEVLRSQIEDEALVVYDTKNGDMVRRVPMHPKLARYIDRHVGHWPPECAKSTVQKWARASRAKAGLEHIRFHDIRHGTASELINNSVDLYTVGTILGHKDPRSTKRYAHLEQDRLAEAIGKMGTKKRA
ncbi:tyrosine-type recombinase/integrase [Pigmentiphaga sp. YJ18]|uniref:tyrosine-type recombinase/integrase n=1 Tax=Pigmentiphaga sp. YJ18 TaxID=3134907 RepID=UPI003114E4D4